MEDLILKESPELFTNTGVIYLLKFGVDSRYTPMPYGEVFLRAKI
jgi:hypothetical protein